METSAIWTSRAQSSPTAKLSLTAGSTMIPLLTRSTMLATLAGFSDTLRKAPTVGAFGSREATVTSSRKDSFLRRAHGQSGFNDSIRRMQSDRKPIVRRRVT
jgi:hypothetical protein